MMPPRHSASLPYGYVLGNVASEMNSDSQPSLLIINEFMELISFLA